MFPEPCAEGKETPPVVRGAIPRFVLGLNATLLIFAASCAVKACVVADGVDVYGAAGLIKYLTYERETEHFSNEEAS